MPPKKFLPNAMLGEPPVEAIGGFSLKCGASLTGAAGSSDSTKTVRRAKSPAHYWSRLSLAPNEYREYLLGEGAKRSPGGQALRM